MGLLIHHVSFGYTLHNALEVCVMQCQIDTTCIYTGADDVGDQSGTNFQHYRHEQRCTY